MESIIITYNKEKVKISINDKYNRLTIKKLFKENYKWYATCECKCGQIVKKIDVRSLLSGNTKSCGCYNKELTIKRNFKHGYKTRNEKNKRLYFIWSDMRRRCNNTFRKDAKNYALKEIKVCNEWNDFETFMKWALSNGYNDNLTIERIDNRVLHLP